MGTTYESAKGIVFIASDNATFMAGSVRARAKAAVMSNMLKNLARRAVTFCCD
jgi:hypothetical protein